jgi:hypothetical protein
VLWTAGCGASVPPPPVGPERVTVQRPAVCRGVRIPALGDDIRESWAQRTDALKSANANAEACGDWIETHYGGR